MHVLDFFLSYYENITNIFILTLWLYIKVLISLKTTIMGLSKDFSTTNIKKCPQF